MLERAVADVERALANLVQPDERQAHAVQARSEIDLRLGAAFTRMQTLALQDRFDGINGLLSCEHRRREPRAHARPPSRRRARPRRARHHRTPRPAGTRHG